jgi:hypothetical protein
MIYYSILTDFLDPDGNHGATSEQQNASMWQQEKKDRHDTYMDTVEYLVKK